MSQWLPLSSSVLLTVVDKLPNPAEAQAIRMPKILKGSATHSTGAPNDLEKALCECDSSDDAPTVAYISKMFSVPASMLPSNRRVQLSAEEMRERRREALKRQQEAAIVGSDAGSTDTHLAGPAPVHLDANDGVIRSGPEATTDTTAKPPQGDALVGFARIYSGTIRVGQTIQVLGPKYDPSHPDRHRTEITVETLYLMMGRDLQALDEVPAGNIFGIGGLQEHVLKTGTLSSTKDCPSFGGLKMEAPIVRVALEPRDPSK